MRMTPREPSMPQLDLVFEEPAQLRRIWPVRELVQLVREICGAGSVAVVQ